MAISTPVLLVVEDELPLLQAIDVEAGKVGFETVSARSVMESIGMLQQVPSIDVVWVDHFLPDHIGLELVNYMRKDKKWKSTPIFLVTNVVEPDIINKYLKAGIQGYYTKMLMGLGDTLREIKKQLILPAA